VRSASFIAMRRDATAAIAAAWLAATFGGCLEPRESPPEPDNNCASCHGSSERVGTDLEQAAPPHDLAGNTLPTAPGVGMHQLHLRATPSHGPIACDECHLVPAFTDAVGHADSAPPAEYIPGPFARIGDRTPAYDPTTRSCSDVYCHGDGTPIWNQPRTLECDLCHGLPPPPPHPPVGPTTCNKCHEHLDEDNGFIDPDKHVNGETDL